MKTRDQLMFALTGWIAGILITLGVGFVIFPAIMQGDRFALTATNILILTLVLILVSPAALVGGWVGGRLPKEGGQTSQIIFAAIIGIVLALPFSCLGFWYSGW